MNLKDTKNIVVLAQEKQDAEEWEMASLDTQEGAIMWSVKGLLNENMPNIPFLWGTAEIKCTADL